MFVDREDELAYLEELYRKAGSRLFIVYGRRRVGKTELLRRFSANKSHIFFSCDLSSEREQLRQFTEKIYHATGDSFLLSQPFQSWEALFRYLFDREGISLVVIDEFPYLCMVNKALPSILQKVWDEKANGGDLLLILCGSYMGFMEKEVLGHKSPLFGRRTGQMVLGPLRFEDIAGFYPNYSKEERVQTYAILGGTPAYLKRFDPEKGIESNVKEGILNKNSFLYSEPRFLLMEELRDPSLYFSVLKAIAFGKTRLNEIVQDAGIGDRHKVNKYLTVLRELRIVKREVPVTEEMPHKSRRGVYLLRDPFFRFWFRYVFPNVGYLEEGEVDYVWNTKILSTFDGFVGFVFEDICMEMLKGFNKLGRLPFKASRIGRWWDGEDEIDIVALGEDHSCLLCECKWTERKVGLSLFQALERKAEKFARFKKIYFGFFSKSGFTQELEDLAAKRGDLMLYGF